MDYIGNYNYSYDWLSLKVIVSNNWAIIGWSKYMIYDAAIIIYQYIWTKVLNIRWIYNYFTMEVSTIEHLDEYYSANTL